MVIWAIKMEDRSETAHLSQILDLAEVLIVLTDREIDMMLKLSSLTCRWLAMYAHALLQFWQLSFLFRRGAERSGWSIPKELHVYAMKFLTSCQGSPSEEWCNVMHVDTAIEGVSLVQYWKRFSVDPSIRT